jgi:hypothetical protein
MLFLIETLIKLFNHYDMGYQKLRTDIIAITYVNNRGEIININSSPKTIKNEFKEIGILIDELIIDDVLLQLSRLSIDELRLSKGQNGRVSVSKLMEIFNFQRIKTLKCYILGVVFNLYNNNLKELPEEFKRTFEDQLTFI